MIMHSEMAELELNPCLRTPKRFVSVHLCPRKADSGEPGQKLWSGRAENAALLEGTIFSPLACGNYDMTWALHLQQLFVMIYKKDITCTLQVLFSPNLQLA